MSDTIGDLKGVPAIFSCVKGDQWPTTSFQSFIEAAHNPLTEDSVVFICPAGHRFTLRQALKKGIFTQEQGKKLMAGAKKQKEEYFDKGGNFRWPASSTIPTKEIESMDLYCVRCNEEAKFVVPGVIRHEEQGRWQEFALCLQCAADFANWDKGEAFGSLYNRLHPRKRYFLWKEVFRRFCRGESPLDFDETEKLLQGYHKQIKLSAKKRRRKR